jgi:hypothetical protein
MVIGFGNLRLRFHVTISVMSSGFQCAYCGEWNVTEIDESAGSVQRYVEDCQVCCQPNVLKVSFDRREDRFMIRAEREG